jgi:hypothetical protein
VAETKKPYPLRLDPEIYEALRRWADDELRSVNGQIEFLIARALGEAGRLPRGARGARAEKRPRDQEGGTRS